MWRCDVAKHSQYRHAEARDVPGSAVIDLCMCRATKMHDGLLESDRRNPSDK